MINMLDNHLGQRSDILLFLGQIMIDTLDINIGVGLFVECV